MDTITNSKVPFFKKTSVSKIRLKKSSKSTSSKRALGKASVTKITFKLRIPKMSPSKPVFTAPLMDHERFLINGGRKILILSTECLKWRAAERFREALQQLGEDESEIPYAISRWLESRKK